MAEHSTSEIKSLQEQNRLLNFVIANLSLSRDALQIYKDFSRIMIMAGKKSKLKEAEMEFYLKRVFGKPSFRWVIFRLTY